MTKKVKRYSEEFKAEAVKAIENNGGNVSGTARQLGLPMQKLANWQRKANQGKLKGTKQFDSELMAVIEENKRLKRELKIAQEEREILKKATAYFARNGRSSLSPIFNFFNKYPEYLLITCMPVNMDSSPLNSKTILLSQ